MTLRNTMNSGRATPSGSAHFQKSRLGRLLVNRGYISEQQLDQVLIEQAQSGLRLGELLVSKGWVQEIDLARVLKQQSNYRKIATVVALATAPLQPMLAVAATPSGLPLNNTRIEAEEISAFGKMSGLTMLDDEEMSGISAQGFAPNQVFGLAESTTIAMAQNLDVASGMTNRFREEEEERDNKPEEQIARELNDTVLSAMGFGPISSLLEADMSIEGVKYMEGRAPVEVLSDGRIRFYMPAEIERISMENIRVKGDTDGASFGSIYMSDIKFGEGSNYTISAHRD